MTGPKSAFDASQGSPNLGAIQYLQDNWGKDEISSAVRVAKVSITASGTAGVSASIPVGAEIIDTHCICKATVGSGSARVRVGGGGNNITDAITMATNDALTRASSIDTTYSLVGSDGIEVVTNSDNDRGDVYIFYKK